MTLSTPGAGRSRGRRTLWWLLGIATAATLVVLLFVLLTPALLLMNMASRRDELEHAEERWQRQQATQALDRLHSAAADGKLTGPEFSQAVGRQWSVERTATQVRVLTGYPVKETGGCYLAVIALPLGPNSKSSLEEGASCPGEQSVVPTTAS